MPKPGAYEQMMLEEKRKAEIISNGKLVYGQKYPNGHDWGVYFSQNFRQDKYCHKAYLVVYTTPNSLLDRVALINSAYCVSEEAALRRLAELLSMSANDYFESPYGARI